MSTEGSPKLTQLSRCFVVFRFSVVCRRALAQGLLKQCNLTKTCSGRRTWVFWGSAVAHAIAEQLSRFAQQAKVKGLGRAPFSRLKPIPRVNWWWYCAGFFVKTRVHRCTDILRLHTQIRATNHEIDANNCEHCAASAQKQPRREQHVAEPVDVSSGCHLYAARGGRCL